MDHWVINYLVGGFNPSEKYLSVGVIIPNIWKKVPNHQPANRSLTRPKRIHVLGGSWLIEPSRHFKTALLFGGITFVALLESENHAHRIHGAGSIC